MRHRQPRNFAVSGYAIPQFAKRFDLPVGRVRRALANGDITAVPFGGLPRIPPSEAERIVESFRLKPVEDGQS